jgi:hypothetical protein
VKAKGIIIVSLLLGASALCYFLGYRNGKRAEQRQRLHFDITSSVLLYGTAERGDLMSVRSTLGMMVLGSTRTYEKLIGSEPASDSFAQRLTEARRISSQVETNLIRIGAP